MTTRWQQVNSCFLKCNNSRGVFKLWMSPVAEICDSPTPFHQGPRKSMVSHVLWKILWARVCVCVCTGTLIPALKFLLTTSHHLGECQLPRGLHSRGCSEQGP